VAAPSAATAAQSHISGSGSVSGQCGLTAASRRGDATGQPTVAWTEHLGTGRGQNFTGKRCGEEQGKGDMFLRPNGRKQVGLRNSSRPRRSETDTWGPRGTEASLAVTWGRKWRGPLWRNELGRECCRNRSARRKRPTILFPICNPFSKLKN
jgi:hypothetical protein